MTFKPIINLVMGDDISVFIGEYRGEAHIVAETKDKISFRKITPEKLKEYSEVLKHDHRDRTEKRN